MVPTTPHPLPSSPGSPLSLSYPPYSATRAAEEQEVELKSGDEREREEAHNSRDDRSGQAASSPEEEGQLLWGREGSKLMGDGGGPFEEFGQWGMGSKMGG